MQENAEKLPSACYWFSTCN